MSAAATSSPSPSDRHRLVGHKPDEPLPPLRGRARELSSIAALLDDRDDAGPLLLRGIPGIGKTRLLAAAMTLAEDLGWSTVTATPDVDSALTPLGALVDASLRAHPPLLDATDLAPALAAADPRYWITRLLTDALERRAREGRTLVIVDDLQWLDSGSLATVRTLIDTLDGVPVRFILATRPGGFRAAHDRLVERIAQSGTLIDLSPVSDRAGDEIVADVLGMPPAPSLKRALVPTENVPLLLVEMVRGLDEEHLLERRDGTVGAAGDRTPARFGASARRRVAHLDPDALRIAQVGSLFGRRFRLSDALGVLGMRAGTASAAVQHLLGHEIVVDDGTHLAFTHDTLREGAEATLSSSLHRALSREVIAARLAAGEPASAVAASAVAAAEPGDDASVELIATAAGQLAATDAGEAAALAASAVRLAGSAPRFAGLLATLLPILWAGGDADLARDTSTQIGPLLGAEGRARTLLGIARLETETSFDRAIAVCDTALDIADVSRATRAELLAVRALNCANKADPVELRRTLELARATADPDQDHLALATIDATESVFVFNSGRFDDATTLMTSAVGRVLLAGHTPSLWVPEGLWPAFLQNSQGHPELALALVDRGLADARRARNVPAEASWMMVRARVLYDLGQLDEARLQSESVLGMADEVGLGDFAQATAGVVLFRLALHSGDLGAQQRFLPAITALAAGTAVTRAGRWALAMAAHERGDTAQAVSLSAGAVAALTDPIPAMSTPADLADDLLLAEILRAGGRDEDLRVLAEVTASRAAANPGYALAQAVDDAVRGLAAADPALLGAAAVALRSLHRPLVLARVLEMARLDVFDDTVARVWLDEALRIYQRAGAARDADRVLQLLRERGVHRRLAATDAGDPLTARERQVVALVASGATTQQIADAMFVSPHTVITHIRHVYAKLGLASRRDLAAWHAASAP